MTAAEFLRASKRPKCEMPIGKGFVGINRLQCYFNRLENNESTIGAIRSRRWIWRSPRSRLSCHRLRSALETSSDAPMAHITLSEIHNAFAAMFSWRSAEELHDRFGQTGCFVQKCYAG
jgi:hypothetical protein